MHGMAWGWSGAPEERHQKVSPALKGALGATRMAAVCTAGVATMLPGSLSDNPLLLDLQSGDGTRK